MRGRYLPIVLACFVVTTVSLAAEREIPGWGTAVDADGDCIFFVVEGQLRITAPGPVHGLSIELERMNAPRVLRAVKGNFVADLTVSGEFAPGEQTLPQRAAFNGAGILLMQDEKNYVRLERATFERNSNLRHYTSFQVRENGEKPRYLGADNPNVEAATPTHLRLERRGSTLYASVRQGDGRWQHMVPKEVDLKDELKIGVAAVNASSQQFVPEFSDFKITSGDE